MGKAEAPNMGAGHRAGSYRYKNYLLAITSSVLILVGTIGGKVDVRVSTDIRIRPAGRAVGLRSSYKSAKSQCSIQALERSAAIT